uniref:dicarboxylate/amino acid:cation symporter n=1 Tax=Candidatus Electrothrix sp. TaxID=2170559 RepID=UPI004056CD61
MNEEKKQNIIGRILLHPITVFISMALGIFLGIYHKELSTQISPIGIIYLYLLQMCVLPIMISAILVSVGRLLMSGSANNYILRVAIIFIVGMLVAAIVGAGLGVLGGLGKHLDKEHKAFLGKEISKVELKNDAEFSTPPKSFGIFSLLQQNIPTNIFRSLADGHTLPVLFFCIITGIALGSLDPDRANTVLNVIDASYEAMLKVIVWLLYGLPFGLCSLFAHQIGRIGPGIFMSLFKLVFLTYIASGILIALYSLIIWRKSGESYINSLLALRKALTVALGTSSSFAALPFALKGLHSELNFNKDTVDLVMPLGITLNPHGNILCFSMIGVFMSFLYNVPVTTTSFILILVTSILAGIAASSAPGIAGLAMLSLVLDPLGLPVIVAVILVTSIDPIIDPVLTAVNLHGNCASLAMVSQENIQS